MAEEQNEAPLIDPNLLAPKDKPAAKPKAAKTAKTAKAPKAAKDAGGFTWGTGRRKSSVARVRIRPGKGELVINKRQIDKYFTQSQDKKAIFSPLKAVNAEKTFDVFVNVKGGGTTGQAGAVMLGIARALKKYDEGFMKQLRDGGYLTRDSRMVERKKPGQRGARRKFQFSKR